MLKGLRIAILAAITPFLFGQMCGTAPEPFDRLAVNDSLRSACADFGITDAQIESTITSAETDRVSGIPKNVEVQSITAVCYDPSDPEGWVACNTCGIAVIDQVYGE